MVAVGAGFAGIYQIYRLREIDFSVRLFEARAAPGRVWYWNRYLGARVEVSPPVYELSFEAVWKDWISKEKFPSCNELAAYFQHAVKQLDCV